MKKLQRGLTLITALAIVAIFLAIALMMLELATHNSQNVGASYTKQQYFDVAEAGIDRGLTDIDSNLPAPGSTGFGTAPPNPPATPSGDQTALPSEPNVPYHYSYWHNPNPTAISTADPLHAQGFDGAGSTIAVPGFGTLIWSYTKSTFDGQSTGRDVGVEVLTNVASIEQHTCAVCAGGGITVSGANHPGTASPPPNCGSSAPYDKICTDPSPSPTPTFVPITTGQTYLGQGNCNGLSCAYGDGTSAPFPNISQNADSNQFLDSQATIDEMGNGAMWQSLSNSNGNVFYKSCSSGCNYSAISNINKNNGGIGVGQVAFFDGNVALSGNSSSSASYAGLLIIGGCFSISGGTLNGTTTTAETIVLGSDSQCGGNAFSVSGNGLWNGGTLYTANGSVSITGTGNVKYTNFYGDIISAGTVTIGGNGNFAYQQGAQGTTTSFGQYAVESFMQY